MLGLLTTLTPSRTRSGYWSAEWQVGPVYGRTSLYFGRLQAYCNPVPLSLRASSAQVRRDLDVAFAGQARIQEVLR